jgi:hypothetical protein
MPYSVLASCPLKHFLHASARGDQSIYPALRLLFPRSPEPECMRHDVAALVISLLQLLSEALCFLSTFCSLLSVKLSLKSERDLLSSLQNVNDINVELDSGLRAAMN